jgi:hypothetical protein
MKSGKNERYSRENISKRNGKKIVGGVRDDGTVGRSGFVEGRVGA